MSQTKTRRPTKRQLGQFMTPPALAANLLAPLSVSSTTRVLEPSFGDGSFIIALIEKFMLLYEGPIHERLDAILTHNIFGVEIDAALYRSCLEKIKVRWGHLPQIHNLVRADFFCHTFTLHQSFDLIVGNPPFGGTIEPLIQEKLDRVYGMRNGEKIKKETYAFFVVKCLDELAPRGMLQFICSDTFMTIPTMKGLRRLMMEKCSVTVDDLHTFSEETSYPMVLLTLARSERVDHVTINGRQIPRDAMQLTGNYSWAITENYARYFTGPKLGQYVICSSGMTIGKNELFVRDIVDGQIVEPYEFEFFDDPITVEGELERAKHHTLSLKLLERVRQQEQSGATRKNVRPLSKARSEHLSLPHPDYRYYNKAVGDIIYSRPTYAIYWRDDGDAVLTFKKNGPWYLHGVGGQPYFGRSGLTWQLIASRLNVRYLPAGYIMDSGAPCAFLRAGIHESELFFILGWTCTHLCTTILKTVINHTQNIQSKDVERLPYPFWVDDTDKERAIAIVQALIERAMSGVTIPRSDPKIAVLDALYAYREAANHQPLPPDPRLEPLQLALF